MGAALVLTTASPDFFSPGELGLKNCIHKRTMGGDAFHIRPIPIDVNLARLPML